MFLNVFKKHFVYVIDLCNGFIATVQLQNPVRSPHAGQSLSKGRLVFLRFAVGKYVNRIGLSY